MKIADEFHAVLHGLHGGYTREGLAPGKHHAALGDARALKRHDADQGVVIVEGHRA